MDKLLQVDESNAGSNCCRLQANVSKQVILAINKWAGTCKSSIKNVLYYNIIKKLVFSGFMMQKKSGAYPGATGKF